jgi:hypothetical protein
MAKKIETKTATKPAAPKKTRAKKTANAEVGNLCIHALALYTNATIKERKDDYVLLDIPYTLIVGKNMAGFRVEFKMCPASINYDVKDKTIAEIGERMFGFAFDLLRKEPNVLGIDDKPLSTLKNFTVVTTYGDKFIWNNGTYKTVKANAPKKAKK